MLNSDSTLPDDWEGIMRINVKFVGMTEVLIVEDSFTRLDTLIQQIRELFSISHDTTLFLYYSDSNGEAIPLVNDSEFQKLATDASSPYITVETQVKRSELAQESRKDEDSHDPAILDVDIPATVELETEEASENTEKDDKMPGSYSKVHVEGYVFHFDVVGLLVLALAVFWIMT
ncbi:hypothetical protein HDU99_008680 [Rhizoclosmatium hyalinum]|nr:hypothetical protein HDU99_008680 [Rhizoclosmatium hyalinum]